MDFGVYTRPDVLEHKIRDGHRADGRFCFWQMGRVPKVASGDRVWFATGGRWRGSFEVLYVQENRIEWVSETWRPWDGEPIERTPFRGFTYNVPKGGRTRAPDEKTTR